MNMQLRKRTVFNYSTHRTFEHLCRQKPPLNRCRGGQLCIRATTLKQTATEVECINHSWGRSSLLILQTIFSCANRAAHFDSAPSQMFNVYVNVVQHRCRWSTTTTTRLLCKIAPLTGSVARPSLRVEHMV